MSSRQKIFVQELTELNIALGIDALQVGKALTVKHSATERRTFVRTMFAQIEGMNFNMKQIVLRIQQHKQVPLSEGELGMLREISYDLDKTGEIRSQVKYLSLLPNIRFTFAVFAKAFGSSYKLDVGNSGWANLRLAVEVRNRITHPKNSGELTISIEEMDKILAGYEWYTSNVVSLLESCAKASK